MSEFTEAYARYWAQRKAYQKADRESLDTRLKPEADALARAISEEQAAGKNITTLQFEVGNHNRNFFYGIMNNGGYRSYVSPVKESEKSEKPKKKTELGLDKNKHEIWTHEIVKDDEKSYKIVLWSDTQRETREVRVADDGYPIVLDSWFEDSDTNRATQVAKAVAEIRKITVPADHTGALPDSTDF